MNVLPYAAAALVGYLLGALPFGFLVARWHGVDIFKAGSGNPGATNVKRVIGKGAGNTVFVLDFIKGAIAAAWVALLPAEGEMTGDVLGIVGMSSAILGHSFSVFTGFRGGKGVATMLGGAVALMPVGALVGALVWVVLFYSTRYVSVASIGLALALPAGVFLSRGAGVLFYFALLVGIFVVVRHRENIGRLVRGTESRFQGRSTPAAPESNQEKTQ